MTAGLFDYILSLVLVVLAWQMLRVRDLFAGIVLYMVFGLLMALAWIELRAPDIALVEAAIGAGVIGALFLGMLGRLEDKTVPAQKPAPPWSGNKAKNMIAALCVLTGVILTLSVLGLPAHSSGLGGRVDEAMRQSGADNPVTAVILNFRAYDTLLEIGVLMLVALASAALVRFDLIKARPVPPAGRVLKTFVHLVVPFMLLIAGYLLWAGSDRPGGAFQAGAIFSATGILALLAGIRINLNMKKVWFRALLSAGFLAFLGAGVMVMGNGRNYLQYPVDSAKFLIVFIEIMAAASITIIFVYLFAVCSGFLKETVSSGEYAREDGER